MKRTIAFILALLLIGTLFVGCGKNQEKKKSANRDKVERQIYDPLDEGKIVTVVDEEYVDEFVLDYVDSCVDGYTKDAVKYRFTEEKYEEFIYDYNDVVMDECKSLIKTPHQYTHFNLHNAEIIIGLQDGIYEQTGESVLKAEAQEIGKTALKFQMNTKEPIDTISITYRNADSGEIYFIHKEKA